jgi:hypothetical protein
MERNDGTFLIVIIICRDEIITRIIQGEVIIASTVPALRRKTRENHIIVITHLKRTESGDPRCRSQRVFRTNRDGCTARICDQQLEGIDRPEKGEIGNHNLYRIHHLHI